MRRSVGWFKRFSLGLTFELSLKGDVYKTKHTSKKRHKPNFDFTLNYFHRSRELALKPALLRSDVISAVWPETMFAVKCVLQMLDWMHLLVIYLQTYLLFNIVLPSFMIYCPIFFKSVFVIAVDSFIYCSCDLLLIRKQRSWPYFLAFLSSYNPSKSNVAFSCWPACFLLSVWRTVHLSFNGVHVSKVYLHWPDAHAKAIIKNVSAPGGATCVG